MKSKVLILKALFIAFSAMNSNQMLAQNNESKSNGILEIVAVYAPDFIVVKPAKGKEIKNVEAWFVDETKSYKALKINALSVSVEIEKSGKLLSTFTDETEIRMMGFNISSSSFFKAQKIRFMVDGTSEMYYNIARSEWELNQNVSDVKITEKPANTTPALNTVSSPASGEVSVSANSQAIHPPSSTQKNNNSVFEIIRFSNDSVKFKAVEETNFYGVALVSGDQMIEAGSFSNSIETVRWANGAQFLPGSSMSLPATFGMGAMTLPKGTILTVFGFKTPAIFKSTKIRFTTNGTDEMYYNIAKSEWESKPGEKAGNQLPAENPPAQEIAKNDVKEPITVEKKLSIPLNIKYLKDGKIIPNTVVYLLYRESGKSELIEKTANTGNGNIVSFDLPLDKDGASYPFVVLFTKEEVNKIKELAKTTTIRAYRTPPGENCKLLELSVTKGGGMKNEGCSIQIWSI